MKNVHINSTSLIVPKQTGFNFTFDKTNFLLWKSLSCSIQRIRTRVLLSHVKHQHFGKRSPDVHPTYRCIGALAAVFACTHPPPLEGGKEEKARRMKICIRLMFLVNLIGESHRGNFSCGQTWNVWKRNRPPVICNHREKLLEIWNFTTELRFFNFK